MDSKPPISIKPQDASKPATRCLKTCARPGCSNMVEANKVYCGRNCWKLDESPR
jgi:hypothetical protein